MFTVVAIALFLSVPAFAQSSHQGKVVSAGEGKLTMTDTAGQNQHTHEVAAEAVITCEGKTCGLAEVKAGDAVTVTLEKKGDKTVVTKIEAKKAGS
jgi:hypothetical protein